MDHRILRTIFILQAWILISTAAHDQTLCGDSKRDASLPDQMFAVVEYSFIPSLKQCMWTITASLGKKVQLNFTNMNFASSANCMDTRFEIYDGPDASGLKLGEICNMNGQTSFVSESHQMFLRFLAVNLNYAQGFTASYGQIDGITPNQHDQSICGESVINTAIGNPSWIVPVGGVKAQNKQCRWRMYADYGHVVELSVNEVTFSGNAQCSTNKLEVYNGPSDAGTPMATICQSPKNATYRSTGQEMFVKFIAMDVTAGKGFKAAYKQVNEAKMLLIDEKWMTLLALVLFAKQY